MSFIAGSEAPGRLNSYSKIRPETFKSPKSVDGRGSRLVNTIVSLARFRNTLEIEGTGQMIDMNFFRLTERDEMLGDLSFMRDFTLILSGDHAIIGEPCKGVKYAHIGRIVFTDGSFFCQDASYLKEFFRMTAPREILLTRCTGEPGAKATPTEPIAVRSLLFYHCPPDFPEAAFRLLVPTEKLSISRCHLRCLDFLAGSTDLREVYLTNNEITNSELKVFGGFKSLKILDLSHNLLQLPSDPSDWERSDLGFCLVAEIVDISSNPVTKNPRVMGMFPHIHTPFQRRVKEMNGVPWEYVLEYSRTLDVSKASRVWVREASSAPVARETPAPQSGFTTRRKSRAILCVTAGDPSRESGDDSPASDGLRSALREHFERMNAASSKIQPRKEKTSRIIAAENSAMAREELEKSEYDTVIQSAKDFIRSHEHNMKSYGVDTRKKLTVYVEYVGEDGSQLLTKEFSFLTRAGMDFVLSILRSNNGLIDESSIVDLKLAFPQIEQKRAQKRRQCLSLPAMERLYLETEYLNEKNFGPILNERSVLLCYLVSVEAGDRPSDLTKCYVIYTRKGFVLVYDERMKLLHSVREGRVAHFEASNEQSASTKMGFVVRTRSNSEIVFLSASDEATFVFLDEISKYITVKHFGRARERERTSKSRSASDFEPSASSSSPPQYPVPATERRQFLIRLHLGRDPESVHSPLVLRFTTDKNKTHLIIVESVLQIFRSKRTKRQISPLDPAGDVGAGFYVLRSDVFGIMYSNDGVWRLEFVGEDLSSTILEVSLLDETYVLEFVKVFIRLQKMHFHREISIVKRLRR